MWYLFLVSIIVVCSASFRASGTTDISSARLFENAVSAIEENYVDPSRIDPSKMLDGALNQIQRVIPEVLIKDRSQGSLTVVVGLALKRFNLGNLNSMSDLSRAMKDILSFIAANYHGDTPAEEIEYAAIDGMLEILDPHSNFLPPKVYKEFQVGTRGKFGGLGIVISIKDGQLAVVAPIEDTPAARAGVKTGDRILQINDESTINMSLTDAVNKLRGDIGSKVSIVTEREGQAPAKITLTRALINIDSVKHAILKEGEKRIGYLKVKSFQANTNEDVSQALKEFHAGGAKLDGLVLDLRNNPGGLLNIAVDLADFFLKEGVIVSTVGARDQVFEKDVAHGPGTEADYPIVVLINEGSASASEIVAGALQANDRAIVMGRRSFGKGSVQTLFELGDNTALKLTIAQYKPAGTLTIQLVGVTPDINLKPVTVDRKAMNLVEDVLPSEFDLEQHLNVKLGRKMQPSMKSMFDIPFLKPKENEKETEEESIKEYTNAPEVEKDFAIVLARKMIAGAGKARRDEMLKSLSDVVESAKTSEEKKIDTALKPWGINWEQAKLTGEPKLTLAYRLKYGGAQIQKAKAGQKIELEFTATNTGTGPYSKLIAVGQSEMPFLANREFPFGRIDSGSSHTWSTPIELPQSLPTQDLVLDVTFEESNGRQPEPLDVIIPVTEIPEPVFGFSIKGSPDLFSKPFAGRGSIPLDIEVTNVGSGGTSKDTQATLSNECGDKMFIEKGRMKLGAMAPGTLRHAQFKFHIVPQTNHTANCELKLVLADIKRLVFLTKKIKLDPISGGIKPEPGIRYEPPTITLSKLPSSTKDTSVKIHGTIKDTDKIRDYFVFVGDKKIAYAPNITDDTSLEFDVTAELEPGPNQITVGARDALDLLGRKVVVVDRTSGERKKEQKPRDVMLFEGMQGR